MDILICNNSPPEGEHYKVVQLNDKEVRKDDIFAFVPNRRIESISKDNLCFIPFGPRSYEYQQNSNAVHYHIGEDKVIVFRTNVTYPIHKKIGLSHNEELDISLIVGEFFLNEGDTVSFNFKPELTGKQLTYFEKCVEDGRYKCLNN